MRDDSSSTEIPGKIEISPYHKDKLADARKSFDELKNMSLSVAGDHAKKEYHDEIERNKKSKSENDQQLKSYEDMLLKVKSWNPPSSEHVNLKGFMISQIEESISFDCDRDYLNKENVLLTPEQWISKELKKSVRDIDYHESEYEKECERINQRNKWISQLRNSLN
jgi:hypothetical protein